MANEFEHILLCDKCISVIRSRGEKVYVGPVVDKGDDDSIKCEWCEDEFDELKDCHF